jgi:hypothetical protein
MRRITGISAYHWYLGSPCWQVRRRAALSAQTICAATADNILPLAAERLAATSLWKTKLLVSHW